MLTVEQLSVTLRKLCDCHPFLPQNPLPQSKTNVCAVVIYSPQSLSVVDLWKHPLFLDFIIHLQLFKKSPKTWKMAETIGISWSSPTPPPWASNAVKVAQLIVQVELPAWFVEVLPPDFHWWPPFLSTSMIHSCMSVLSTLLSLSFYRVELNVDFELWSSTFVAAVFPTI